VQGYYARTSLPQSLGSATYDNGNQIATWSGTSFTYDHNGNLTSDGSKTYTWNARNELTGIAGGVNAAFAYDGWGRRRSRTVGGATTHFLYDGLNVVQELSSGVPSANMLTGLDLDEQFRRVDSVVRYHLADGLGTTIGLVDGNGTLQTEYTYDPFGTFTTTGASTTNTLAFTGRESDGTGLTFLRARYYDSRLQRFLGRDPLRFEGGINEFVYVGNRPTIDTDPLGLKPKSGTGRGTGGGPAGPGSGTGSGAGAPGTPAPGSPNDPSCPPPSCIGIFLACLADWAAPGLSNAIETAAAAGAHARGVSLYNQALDHAAARGLRYPQKSSIFRGLMQKSSAMLNVASKTIPLIGANVAIYHCLGREISAATSGACR
jgi:RHS repeat-associated protein